jgi:hypothetical protein
LDKNYWKAAVRELLKLYIAAANVNAIWQRLRGNSPGALANLMLSGTAERNLRGRGAMYEVAQVGKRWRGKGGGSTRATGERGDAV